MLNLFSAIAGFSMAILLYSTHLGKPDVSSSVYMAAAFLLVIGTWQTINFIFGLQLRKQFRRRRNNNLDADEATNSAGQISRQDSAKALPNADTNEFIAPPSVTENTTRTLDKIPRR